ERAARAAHAHARAALRHARREVARPVAERSRLAAAAPRLVANWLAAPAPGDGGPHQEPPRPGDGAPYPLPEARFARSIHGLDHGNRSHRPLGPGVASAILALLNAQETTLMRHILSLIGLSSVLCSCGGGAPPPPPPLPFIPIAPPPPPPAAPALLVVPRAEASPQRVPEPRAPKVAELRSEGKRHALERTADGIVVLSEERGVLGLLKSPARGAEVRWAGFVDDDAILIATHDALHRAATPDDAIAGKLE